MALSLGTLFVKLNADPSQLTKGMNEAAEKVAKFGNKMNEVAGKLGAVGVSLTAIGAGAIRLASQFDSQVKTATDELGNSFNAIAVEIGRALVPTIQALSQALTVVANWFRSLSPETKQMVAGFAAVTAGTLTLTAGVAKVVSAFTSLAPLISGALAPVAGSILPIIAVIAAIVAIVPLLWQAWKNNWGNIQGFTGAVIDWIQEKWKSFKNFFGGAIEFIGKAWNNLTEFLWKSWATAMKTVAGWAAKVAKVFGADWTYELEAFNETIDDIANRGFKGLVEDAIEGGKMIAFEWKEGFSDIAGAIKDKVGGAIRGVLGEYGKGLEQMKKDAGGGATKAPPKVIMMEEIQVVGQVEKVTQTWQDGVKVAGDNLLQGLGSLTEVMNAAKAGFEAGGPWGALAGAATALLMKSNAFRVLVEALNGFVQEVADQLGAILAPNFMLLAAVLKAFTPIIKVLMSVMAGPLFLALKALGIVTLSIVWALGVAWNAIIEVVSWIFNTIGDALNLIWGGLGDGMKGIAASMRAGMVDIKGVENDIRTLANMSMDQGGTLTQQGVKPIEILGEAAGDTARTLNELNESITNVPTGFKVAAARFNASDAVTSQAGLTGTGQSSFFISVFIDGRQVSSSVNMNNAKMQQLVNGGFINRNPPPIPPF
jgi:hypothetical protein